MLAYLTKQRTPKVPPALAALHQKQAGPAARDKPATRPPPKPVLGHLWVVLSGQYVRAQQTRVLRQLPDCKVIRCVYDDGRVPPTYIRGIPSVKGHDVGTLWELAM